MDRQGLEDIRDKIRSMENLVIRDGHFTFAEALNIEQKRAKRYKRIFSLLLIDASDLNVVKVVERCDHCLRESDIFGVVVLHIEPESEEGLQKSDLSEWLKDSPAESAAVAVGVLLPETPRDHAERAKARLVAALEPLGEVRIGLATYPDDGADVDELIRCASS